MNPLRVLVAGGGIGGLTAAVALRRAGAAVTVHERAPELRMAQAGHGLVLWHNAVLALRDLGLEPGVEKIGHELREHLFRNSGGAGSPAGPWRGRRPSWGRPSTA
ncbi:FAD-dependent oxidoreductase [Nonomuraea recticatena]|uniref:FAD-dependent oxidoreductase n=1 Tax=Nonomuraea recticatena TaxID=46178 RepID=UPI0036227AEA